ncbi:MAG TPA: hypothetical protein VFL55_00040 [Acetobacteraceae bacterium]|nr:hypothetical protein [Acetobacteraceae bacterium]
MATWFGGTGKFDQPRNWSSHEVPQEGDTAVINTGTVLIRNEEIHGVTFSLQGTSQADQPVLKLKNVDLESNISLSGLATPPGSTFFGELSVSGRVDSSGDISLGSGRGPGSPGDLTVDIKHHSEFVNKGTITLDLASFTVTGASHSSVFVNDGSVVDVGGVVRVDVPVVGQGTFEEPPTIFSPEFTFGDFVGHGITVDLNSQGQPALITLDKPMEFLAEIQGFGSGLPNSINLPNTTVTSEHFANNHLKLFDDHRLVANLNIIGDFTTNQFVLRPGIGGGTEITFASTGTLFPGTPMAITTPADANVVMPIAHS